MTNCKILAKQSEGIHFIKGNISTLKFVSTIFAEKPTIAGTSSFRQMRKRMFPRSGFRVSMKKRAGERSMALPGILKLEFFGQILINKTSDID